MTSSSSCSLEYDPFGRRGIGVAQPQSRSDYPLIGPPSEDIRWLLADLHFVYDDPYDYGEAPGAWRPPFSIWWLYGLGCLDNTASPFAPAPTHDAEILLLDADGYLVFDSTTADSFLPREWGSRFMVYGWESEDAVCSLVAHTKWAETADPLLDPQQYEVNIHPASAILDARSVCRRPKRVKSIRVGLETFENTRLDFVGGFNMNLNRRDPTITGHKRIHPLEFDASPGGGAGVFPGCDPSPLGITRVNNVRPTDAGDFYLSAADCYYVRQPSTLGATNAETTPAMLEIGNDCSPCCGCEDYVATAGYLNRTRDSYHAVGQTAESVRNQYHANRERWCSSKCCFEAHPLRLALQPQLCPYLDVAAQFCNLSDDCVGPLELTIRFVDANNAPSSSSSAAPTSPPGCLQPGFTFIRGARHKPGRRNSFIERYDLEGEWPVFTAYWDAVEPGQNVWVRMRAKYKNQGLAGDGNALLAKVELWGTLNGDPITAADCGDVDLTACSETSETVAVISQQVLLRCPAEAADLFDYQDSIAGLV